MVREERGGGLCCLCFSGARIQAQASTYYKKDICHVDCSDSRVLVNLNYKLAKKFTSQRRGEGKEYMAIHRAPPQNTISGNVQVFFMTFFYVSIDLHIS